MDQFDTAGSTLRARESLATLLRAAGVFGLSTEALESSFVQGLCDPLIEDLPMDSLASMELCILIENHYGVSMAPDELLAHGSLAKILEIIVENK